MHDERVVSVLFCCLGNICRSPTAHGVFASLLEARDLHHTIAVDSCGTGDWHVGDAPDRRAVAEAAKRGYDLSQLRARQVRSTDFAQYEYILAMDYSNLAELESMCPSTFTGHLGLFLPFAESAGSREVPDPYYGGANGFGVVLDMVEEASDGLLKEICRAYSLP